VHDADALVELAGQYCSVTASPVPSSSDAASTALFAPTIVELATSEISACEPAGANAAAVVVAGVVVVVVVVPGVVAAGGVVEGAVHDGHAASALVDAAARPHANAHDMSTAAAKMRTKRALCTDLIVPDVCRNGW
jgi:hypothetical protein